MNKIEIKNILMSMRTPQNEAQVNMLLGKIDMIEEEKLKSMISQIGDNEESIRLYLNNRLNEKMNNYDEHIPINDMFTYGIAGSCIHLHMPVDLHEMIAKFGIKRTVDVVNLKLLDAIERIKQLQNDGFYKLHGKDSIYMISPILAGREMRFLEELDFQTIIYRKKDLQNDQFIKEHDEAKLAKHIFGNRQNVGTAKIDMNTINTDEWQAKRKEKVEELKKSEITIAQEKQDK